MNSTLRKQTILSGVFIASLFSGLHSPLRAQNAPPAPEASSTVQNPPQTSAPVADEPKSVRPKKAGPLPPETEAANKSPAPPRSPSSSSVPEKPAGPVESSAETPPPAAAKPPVTVEKSGADAAPPTNEVAAPRKTSFASFPRLNPWWGFFILIPLAAISVFANILQYQKLKNLGKGAQNPGRSATPLTTMDLEASPSASLPPENLPPASSPATNTLNTKETGDTEVSKSPQPKPEAVAPVPSQAQEAAKLLIVPTIREIQTAGAGAKMELERIRSEMTSIFTRSTEKLASGEIPLIGWGYSLPRVQKLGPEHESKKWFFIGDIHGDFLALHTLLSRAKTVPDFRLAFLGDLVDRGPMSIECFALLLEAAEAYPHQILWIVGNHDVGLQHRQQGGYRSGGVFDSRKFSSRVEPAEFVDWLNNKIEEDPQGKELLWGRLFSQICERLPSAVLFPNGLLATHGGVPLRDRWPTLKNLESFHHERTLEDFTWTRATEYPKKIGYQSDHRGNSSNFEFGYKDFEGFCQAVSQVFPVTQMIRGHDHVPGGFHKHPEYKINPVLTVNGFGFDYLSNSLQEYRAKLCLAVLSPGNPIDVEEIDYAREDYEALYLNGAL